MFCSRYGGSGIILMWVDSKWRKYNNGRQSKWLMMFCVMSVGDVSCYAIKRNYDC